jgi:hypothetical protein
MAQRTAADIVDLLSTSMGEERATALVDDAIAKLDLDRDHVTTTEALDVLECIALEPGVVGITARFAKSRVHLRWDRDS